MDIVITKHARDRMMEYEISEEMLINTINNPDNIASGNLNRKIYQKRLNGHIIRAIVDEGKEIKTVITVYKARRRRYGI